MQIIPRALRPALRRTLVSAALLALGLEAGAQRAAGPQWVPLDDSPVGTAAEILFVADESSEARTTIEVRIHGFWMEDVVGDDGATYQRLDFPGLRAMTQPGAPELPEARALLAIATDASDARLVATQVAAQVSVPDVVVYPAPIPGEDEEIDPSGDPGPGDPNGTPEKFTLDPAIYTGSGVWPVSSGANGVVEAKAGPVTGAAVAGWPAAWKQGSKELVVDTQVKYMFDHAGALLPPAQITKLKDQAYSSVFVNWPETKQVFPFNPTEYHSRYLIVANPLVWDTLASFVAIKKLQGYEVELATAAPDVTAIRQVIAQWYLQGDPGMDHYCLLVGDTLTIPLGAVLVDLKVIRTDDVYGEIGTPNKSKEVHVGRLSIDSEADLQNQLDKIIRYELNPPPGARYDTALLVAHEQDYPGKYSGSHTNVLNETYSHPPTFLTAFGANGATNAQVTNFIQSGLVGDGLGLVAYRGHGSTSAWTGWNTMPEDWHSNNVIGLSNAVHPVVWSIACTNANIDWEPGTSQDSIAEVWMEADAGAVASYAATTTTSTTPNHFLNEALFSFVYGAGITTHAMAIEVSELMVWTLWLGHKNPWAYLLLGDPSMTIRRDAVEDVQVLNLPGFLTMDDAGGQTTLQALFAESGAPLAEGLLSFHKPSFLGGEDDEMLAAFWTDDTGAATLPFDFETPGTLHVMFRDLAGNVAVHDVPVTMGSAWTDLGHELGGAGAPPRLAGIGPLTPGSDVSVLIADAPPSSTAFLCLGPSAVDYAVFGGVLVPNLFVPGGVVVPVATDGDGGAIAKGTWPANAVSGDELFAQAWFVDASGPEGFTATNAIVGRTP